VSTQTELKRQPPARTVLDDVADLEARKVQIDARRNTVGRDAAACRTRIATAETDRDAELAAAVHDLRDPKVEATEKALQDDQSKLAALTDQIAGLRAASTEVDKQIGALRRERRGDFIALARANAEAVVAPLQERLIETARALLAAQRENAEMWRAAFAGTDGGKLNPEVPLGVRVDARLPGGSIADRCTVGRGNRTVVNGTELFHPLGTLAEVVAHLEKVGNVGLPASLVPPDALQGRPGRYLDTVLGAEYHLDLDDLTSPNEADVSVDEYGMAGLRWIAPLPAGRRAQQHQRADWDPATRTFRPAARTTPAESEAA